MAKLGKNQKTSMNSVIETLNQFGGQLLHFAWPMLWQSSLLIALVFALDLLLARKIRASVRYALWLVVLVKLLLPPTLALPTGAAWWLFHAKPAVKAPAIKDYTVTYDTTPLADYIPPTVALPPPAPPKLNGAGWALLATGAISAGLLLWLMLRWWQITRIVHDASVSEELTGLNEEVRRQAGLRSRIRLKLVEGRMSPAVCGLFRPIILLPRALAQNLSAAQLRAVLLHEAFHLRRKDVWVNCVQALLQIVYWWHPLLWIANARIRRLREEAVDDAVMLALRDEADSYAPTLLEVAKLAFRRPLLSLGLVGIMESRSALRQRIERLVDFHAPHKAGLTCASLCGICVFSAVALPMGEAPALVESPSSSASIKAESQPQRALTFRLSHPESEGVLKGQLLEAGVKMPPTIIHDFNNGILFARGTAKQLVLIQQTVFKLNGYSPLKAAAATNIPEYAIKIPVVGEATPQFYSRTFKIGTEAINANLLKEAGAQSNELDSATASVAFMELFTELGLNFKSPPGKSIFYNEKLGKLFVKTTASDLDVIGCAVGAMIQPSAQNAGGYSPPVDATNFVGITGVSANSDFLAAGRAVKQQSGVETLPEPQVTTTSGLEINPIATTNISVPVSKVDAAELVQDGKLLYEMGKLDEAEVKLSQAVNLDTNNTTAYYLNLVKQAQFQHALANNHSNLIAQAQGKTNDPAAGIIYTGEGRQAIINKLDRIHLDRVSFDSLPLSEVLRILAAQSKLRDPEHAGINFLINPSSDKSAGLPTAAPSESGVLGIDPATGLPVATNAADNSEPVDIGSFIVKIHSLTDVRLADVLDAIVVVCDHPIKYSISDFAVVFSAKGPETPQLFSRTFKVEASAFTSALRNVPGLQSNSVSAIARSLFTKLGVDWDSPNGKSVFYNDKLGKLFVKATASDIDTIGRTLESLNMVATQIHIKARFLEMPKEALDGFLTAISVTNRLIQIVGIQEAKDFQKTLRALEARDDVKTLAEPEATTSSGRQTQMRTTDVITIITNFVFKDNFTNSSVEPQVSQIKTGPVFDVVPKVLLDGYTVDLQMTASDLKFVGYANIPTNAVRQTATNSAGEVITLPAAWPAALQYRKSTHVNLFDGQTVILSLNHPEQVSFGEPDEKREAAVAEYIREVQRKNGEKDIIVFVTTTLVDQAGNRIHSEDEMRSAKDRIPPQPSVK